MSESKSVFIVTDADYDRDAGAFTSQAEAVDYARKNVNNFWGKTAYVFRAVTMITPSSPPATVIDL